MSVAHDLHQGSLWQHRGCDVAANLPHLERRHEQWLVGGGRKRPLLFSGFVPVR